MADEETNISKNIEALSSAITDLQSQIADLLSSTSVSSIDTTTLDTVEGIKAAIAAINADRKAAIEVQKSAKALGSVLDETDTITAAQDESFNATIQETTGVDLDKDEPTNCNSEQFQGIRFYDGTGYGYLRVYADKVELLLDKTFEFAIDGTLPHTYRITGEGEDIKVYIDGQLAIDASGHHTLPTSSKLIEFGDIAGRNQKIYSTWDSFKYTTTGAVPPGNTEDLILEEVISFPQASVNRLKTYKNGLYASVTPVDPSKSSSIYRYEEGFEPEHRSVLAVTRSSISAVILDPNRQGSIFETTGKYIGTDSGLQYILGGKPVPFDFVTSFGDDIAASGWNRESNCVDSCESLLNSVLTIDTTEEVDPRYSKYSQSIPTDSWGEGADNAVGWTVEAKVRILNDGSNGTVDGKASFIAGAAATRDCGQIASDTGLLPEDDGLYAPGIYLNDGKFQEIVQFFQKGVRLKYANLFAEQRLSDQFYTIRIVAKNKAIAIFAKGDNESMFRRLLYAPDALRVTAKTQAPQERPAIFVDSSNMVHSVWQEAFPDGLRILYSRLAKTTKAQGTGIIGSKQYDPENSVIPARGGLGLPDVSIRDYSKIRDNVLIIPSGTLVSGGVREGDLLTVILDGSNREYVIKNVIDEILLELDTPDNLSDLGPAEWFIASGAESWQTSVSVSNNSFDSANPRILNHSNGQVFVVYDNNQNGNNEIYLRQGSASPKGVAWGDTIRITNSARNARNPDICELKDGDIMVVWEDSSADSTGSQIYGIVLPHSFSNPIEKKPTSLTPESLNARNPRIAGIEETVVIVYQDDVETPGTPEIYTLKGTVSSATTPVFDSAVKISSGSKSMNPSVSVIGDTFFAAWEDYSLVKSEIYGATLDRQTDAWTTIRYTNSRGNSRNPAAASDTDGNPVVVFESDRTRQGFFDLYISKFASTADGDPILVASAGIGLDVKLKSYATQNFRPSAALASNGRLAVVWEAERDGRRTTLFGATYDLRSAGIDNTVLAYFPLNETNGTSVYNRILPFEANGNVPSLTNHQGTPSEAVDLFTAASAVPQTSLFNPSENTAFDLNQDGRVFSAKTTKYIRQSGAIDLFLTPHWNSNSTEEHVFFGNASFADTTPNTIVFGHKPEMAGSSLTLRIVDQDSGVHQTVIQGNPLELWDAEETVHLRAIWDSTNIGVSSINGLSFPSTSIGYACAPTGAIFKTTDGGATWVKQVTGVTYDIYSIDFFDATTGIACGELGIILRTTDGGQTWVAQETGFEVDLFSIFMSTASTIFAVGAAGTIIKSSNAGETWTEITLTATADFKSVAKLSNGNILVVGTDNAVYKSSNGTTFTAVTTMPISANWNAISRTHQGPGFSTYITGSGSKVLRTDDSGATWVNVSTVWPDSLNPSILAVSATSSSTTVWITGQRNRIAYSTDSGATWTFVSTNLNGAYRAIEANFGGSLGAGIIVSGIGGNLMFTGNLGTTQTFPTTRCSNLTIIINGKEPSQTRTNDTAFLWDPSEVDDIYFGDYQAGGTSSALSLFDEIVIYGTPTPGNSVYNRHEFRTYQLVASALVTDESGKRIEWGNISSSVKAKSQWQELKMFYCGAREPLMHFGFGALTGMSDDVVYDMAPDQEGFLWIATENGITRLDLNAATAAMQAFLDGRAQPGRELFKVYTNLVDGLIADTVTSISVDENNNVWAGTEKGLMALIRGKKESDGTDPAAEQTVEDDTEKSVGDAGLGTSTSGKSKETSEVFVGVDNASGDLSGRILTIASLKGAIYVGTEKGLVVIDSNDFSNVSTYTTRDGLPSNRIQAIAQESTGEVWIGTNKGLSRFRPGHVVTFSTSNGLVSRDITTIVIDGSDRKLVGTGFGLTILDGTEFTTYAPNSGIGPGAIRDGIADAFGRIWFATSNGLVEMNEHCPEGTRFFTYDAQDGIIGEPLINDYERYRILGGDVPAGGCNKALVQVAVNGRLLPSGFSVDPKVPWVIFEQTKSASDEVEVCVQRGWRKVHDLNFDRRNRTNQATVETSKSVMRLFRKRYPAGDVVLGGNFAEGASNNSTRMYAVFLVSLPGGTGLPASVITTPSTADLLSDTDTGDEIYSDISEEITTLPSEIVGVQRIAMDSGDADDITSNYLQFTLSEDAIVYIAYDSRATTIPTWLRDFEPVEFLARITDMETFVDATNSEKIFVATEGSAGCVYDVLKDESVCDISDQIALDITPPEMCATIAKVNSRSSMTLNIDATDSVTGVTEMQVSPRADGTNDGTTETPFVPFQRNYVFNLPASAVATTGDIADIPDDDGPTGSTSVPLPPNITLNIFHDFKGTLLVGTINPGRVYAFDRATSALSMLFDTGEDEVLSMTTFGDKLIVGTGTNGKAYSWDGTSLTQLPETVGERVMAVHVFNNTVYLGYSPGGQIYTYDEFGVMQLFEDTLETSVTSFATFGGRLYWGTSNETIEEGDVLVTTTKKGHKHYFTVPSGVTRLTQLNGTTTSEDGHTHAIVDGIVQEASGHTHGLNGIESGKVFSFDPVSGQPRIVHPERDFAVTALASSSPDDTSGFLFAGTSPHGKILRYIPDDDIFIKSFQTAKLTVNKLRYIDNIYAVVDDDVYTFTGKRWEFVASITGTAHDVAPEQSGAITPGSDQQILVLKDNKIAATSASPTLLNPKLCAYVRVKDAAGNVSALRDSDGKFVECAVPCIDLGGGGSGGGSGGGGGVTDGGGGTDGGLIIGKNRILEVDPDAKIVFGLDGTEAFLSGNKVEEEVAIYTSEVFNGTNSFVQWVDVSWEATTPSGTSIIIQVRNADTSSELKTAEWGDDLDNPADLTGLAGQFLQFRAILKVVEKGVSSPILHKVSIRLRTSQAVHYFTTNFSLPDELRRGLLTYNGCINPPVTDVIFGICGLDSTDFSDYYVISPDKVFELPEEHQTKNLRVGIRLISSPTEVPVVDEFALLVSLANDANIKFNLAGMPSSTSGQLAPSSSTRTVTTERVQGHAHTVTFDSSILDASGINGRTSVNAGHFHEIVNGVLQQAAGHTHSFEI